MTQEFAKAGQHRASSPSLAARAPVVLVIEAISPSGATSQNDMPDAAFEEASCRPVRAGTTAEIDAIYADTPPDIVFLPLTTQPDTQHPVDCLQSLLSRKPKPVVIVVAGNDEINAATEAMSAGAQDCLFRPFSRSRLLRTIEAATRQLGAEAKRAPDTAPPAAPQPKAPSEAPGPVAQDAAHGDIRSRLAVLNLAGRGFVASSQTMQSVLESVAALAPSDVPVFLTGEVGTGKSTVAAILHELSRRAHGPLITIACATLTAAEFDVRMSGPNGALDRAAGGSLQLDEVADLPLDVQAKVLQMIESAQIDGAHPDVRLIASTGQDPSAAIQNGSLRADLFYRLHVAPIHLPPLRERENDAVLIARVRLAEFSVAEERRFTGLTEAAAAMIARYSWPGNLRELINVIHSLVLLNDGAVVTPDLLPPDLRASLRPGDGTHALPPANSLLPARDTGLGGLVGQSLAEIERQVIEATIEAEGGSVTRAAKVLDVAPSTLYRKRESWTARDS